MVRELGSERRETVWSLSTANVKNWEIPTLVREDRGGSTSGVSVVLLKASPSSYVESKELLKAYKQEIVLKINFFKPVQDQYVDRLEIFKK